MDGQGIPLAGITTKANAHDLTSALATVDSLKIGNQRRRPGRVRADKGYDSIAFRRALRQRGIKSAVDHRRYRQRRGRERSWNDGREIRYGRKRWCVEQRFACLDQNRRLDYLYETTRAAYEGFLTLARVRCYLKLLANCRHKRVFR